MLLDAGPVSTDEQVGSVIGRYVIEKELLPPNLPRPPLPRPFPLNGKFASSLLQDLSRHVDQRIVTFRSTR